jgi:hypothetical protein
MKISLKVSQKREQCALIAVKFVLWDFFVEIVSALCTVAEIVSGMIGNSINGTAKNNL